MGVGDFKGADARYREVYKQAAEETENEFLDLNVELRPVFPKDFASAEKWKGETDYRGIVREAPDGGWDWPTLYERALRAPKYFVYAITCNGQLCALMKGGVSSNKVVANLHYLESSPYITPVTGYILEMSLTFTHTVGSLVGCRYTAIYEPSNVVKDIARSDYGFSEEKPFGMKNAIYFPHKET